MHPLGVLFDPERVYSEYEVRTLGFTEAALKRVHDRGELACKEIGRGRRVYLGRWLLDWLTNCGETLH